ncbi:MAG: hypothetical protein ACYDG2_20750 [Ruminiclostridium sp.]
MKIQILNQNQNRFEFLVEREQGMYNNCNLSITLADVEVQELTDDEIKTLAWLRVKSTAIRVFEQIEPLNEPDNPIGFELIPSAPKRIELYGNAVVAIGDTTEYQATVYDQYNQAMAAEPIWVNKSITAVEPGEVVVTASVGTLSKSLVVNVVERIKSQEEIMQELVDTLLVDNLNMQSQIDTLITSSLGV